MAMELRQAVGQQGVPWAALNVDYNKAIVNAPYVLDEDFMGETLNSDFWDVGDSVNGTITHLANATGAGIVQLQTLAALNNTCNLHTGILQVAPGWTRKPDFMLEGMWFSSIADIVCEFGIYVDANNYIMFRSDDTTYGDDAWRCVCNATGTDTTYDTGISPATSAAARQAFRFINNGTGAGNVEFYLVDGIGPGNSLQDWGTPVTTTTTNVPGGTGKVWVYLKTEAAANKLCYFDRIRHSTLRNS